MEIAVSELSSMLVKIFQKHGLSPQDAKTMAHAIVDAEVKGKPQHGVVLVPRYLEQIPEKKHSPVIEKDRGAFLIIDGGDGLGPIVADFGCKELVLRAKEYGIAGVGIHTKFPFLLAGTYAEKLALEGLVSICMCNSRARVAPFGGYEPVLGPNPIAFGFPTGETPFVIDFATSAVTMGDVRWARREGCRLPPDVAYDKHGNPTRDPDAVLEGSLRVFNGHKGFCLALAIELLAGPLVLAKAGNSVAGTRGYLFIATDPGVAVGHSAFSEAIRTFMQEVRASRSLPGFDRVCLPGERSNRNREVSLSHGITIKDDLYDALSSLARG